MSQIETDMDKLEEARRAESAKTAPIPVAAGKSQPKHREPGDAFIIKLVGKEWLSDHAEKAGLKPGMQVKGILTDSPEGDEFHVVGYEFPLDEDSSVLAGQIFAYDSGTEPWKCQVIERALAGEAEGEDVVNQPGHYKFPGGVEVIDLTENLNFNRGNAVKYLARAGRKSDVDIIQDLRKAEYYVKREIARLEAML